MAKTTSRKSSARGATGAPGRAAAGGARRAARAATRPCAAAGRSSTRRSAARAAGAGRARTGAAHVGEPPRARRGTQAARRRAPARARAAAAARRAARPQPACERGSVATSHGRARPSSSLAAAQRRRAGSGAQQDPRGMAARRGRRADADASVALRAAATTSSRGGARRRACLDPAPPRRYLPRSMGTSPDERGEAATLSGAPSGASDASAERPRRAPGAPRSCRPRRASSTLPGEFALELGGPPARRCASRTGPGARSTRRGANAVVVCHALTGSADADLWWTRLFGPGRALDPERDFVVCSNILGSCYGTTGPAEIDPATGAPVARDVPGDHDPRHGAGAARARRRRSA